jgi:hypothetical protein
VLVPRVSPVLPDCKKPKELPGDATLAVDWPCSEIGDTEEALDLTADISELGGERMVAAGLVLDGATEFGVVTGGSCTVAAIDVTGLEKAGVIAGVIPVSTGLGVRICDGIVKTLPEGPMMSDAKGDGVV